MISSIFRTFLVSSNDGTGSVGTSGAGLAALTHSRCVSLARQLFLAQLPWSNVTNTFLYLGMDGSSVVAAEGTKEREGEEAMMD